MRTNQLREILLIFFLALAVRGVWVYSGIRQWNDVYLPNSDAWQYLVAGRNLRDFGVLSFRPELQPTPSHFRPPGYPAIIAALGCTVPAVLIFQGLLGSLTAALTYVLGLRFSRTIALIAGIGMAVGPMSGVWTGYLMSETVYTFFILLAAVLWSKEKPLASGFALGLSWLVRPTTLALVVLGLLAVFLFYKTHRRQFILITLAAILTVTPWIVRNAIVFHQFIPVAIGGGRGQNLLYGTFDIQYGKQSFWEQALADPDALPAYGWDDPRTQEVYHQRAIQRIKAHPFQWLLIRVKQYPRLLIDLGAYAYPQSIFVTRVMKILFLIGNLIFWVCAAIGIYRARARPVLVLFPILLLVLNLPLWTEARFLLPVTPALSVLAAIGLSRVITPTDNSAPLL